MLITKSFWLQPYWEKQGTSYNNSMLQNFMIYSQNVSRKSAQNQQKPLDQMAQGLRASSSAGV